MASIGDSKEERWKRAVIGPLSPDFLRIATSREVQEAADCQAAMAIYQQQNVSQYMAPNIVGRLSITVAQAKLVRNYGITRMDPYVRVRVGHFVYETPTDPNGSRLPRWNRVIHSQLPSGVNSISIEIYDEYSFKMDELIAWADIKIPEIVLRGETHEEWYPLSGKQGDGLEGTINMVFSFSAQPMHSYMYQPVRQPVVMVSPGYMQPQQQVPIQSQQPVPIQISEADLKLVEEMFPIIDKEVIKSVFEANNGNKDTTINCLLQMTD